jgi:hypothetical protein
MNATDERNWTPKEKELAREIRAAGNDVRCKIHNGRRVFDIVASEDGERITLHTGGDGAVRFRDVPKRPVRGVAR